MTIVSLMTWARSKLANPVLEHSARTSVAATASLLTARLSRLPESYWAAITTLIVMQSALGTTLPIARRQFAGTAVGAGLGAALVTSFAPSILRFGAGIFLLGLICAALSHANRQLRDRLDRTAYRYAGISLAIVMLIAHSESVWVVAVHRFIEVSIGIVVALAITVLWPEPQLPVAPLPQAI